MPWGEEGETSGTLRVRHARDVAPLGHDDMEDFAARAFSAPDYDVFERGDRFLGTIATPE